MLLFQSANESPSPYSCLRLPRMSCLLRWSAVCLLCERGSCLSQILASFPLQQDKAASQLASDRNDSTAAGSLSLALPGGTGAVDAAQSVVTSKPAAAERQEVAAAALVHLKVSGSLASSNTSDHAVIGLASGQGHGLATVGALAAVEPAVLATQGEEADNATGVPAAAVLEAEVAASGDLAGPGVAAGDASLVDATGDAWAAEKPAFDSPLKSGDDTVALLEAGGAANASAIVAGDSTAAAGRGGAESEIAEDAEKNRPRAWTLAELSCWTWLILVPCILVLCVSWRLDTTKRSLLNCDIGGYMERRLAENAAKELDSKEDSIVKWFMAQESRFINSQDAGVSQFGASLQPDHLCADMVVKSAGGASFILEGTLKPQPQDGTVALRTDATRDTILKAKMSETARQGVVIYRSTGEAVAYLDTAAAYGAMPARSIQIFRCANSGADTKAGDCRIGAPFAVAVLQTQVGDVLEVALRSTCPTAQQKGGLLMKASVSGVAGHGVVNVVGPQGMLLCRLDEAVHRDGGDVVQISGNVDIAVLFCLLLAAEKLCP
eukprot:TRINITY_DN79964_c0_g1_i1.p1 TRINITY_DN79964_c0_g1~~TRINITY_DN79964_c0_g1_i1.p1  ORF type:complete len:551 (-),score=121.01 TRINITY_DN79964_c0_g1_i1:108-1760(-)